MGVHVYERLVTLGHVCMFSRAPVVFPYALSSLKRRDNSRMSGAQKVNVTKSWVRTTRDRESGISNDLKTGTDPSDPPIQTLVSVSSSEPEEVTVWKEASSACLVSFCTVNTLKLCPLFVSYLCRRKCIMWFLMFSQTFSIEFKGEFELEAEHGAFKR